MGLTSLSVFIILGCGENSNILSAILRVILRDQMITMKTAMV